MFVLTESSENVMHPLAYGDGERYEIILNDNVIGTLNVINNRTSIYLDSLMIFEEFRGKGIGTQIVSQLFNFFEKAQHIWGIAQEDVLDGFWTKQPGYSYSHACHDEFEGYYAFDLIR